MTIFEIMAAKIKDDEIEVVSVKIRVYFFQLD